MPARRDQGRNGRGRTNKRMRIDIPRRSYPAIYIRMSYVEYLSPSILFSLFHMFDSASNFHEIVLFISDHFKPNIVTDRELREVKSRIHLNGEVYCSICLTDARKREKIRVLPCAHEYHSKCVDKWLKTQENCCPICRKPVIIRD